MSDEVRRDKEGFVLDEDGVRVYPPWANAIPGGAKTSGGNKRPGWVPSWANAWDEAKPPAGWFQIKGEWYSVDNAEAVREHPELLAMAEAARAAKPDDGASKAGGVKCPGCSKPFETPAALRGHRIHCKE